MRHHGRVNDSLLPTPSTPSERARLYPRVTSFRSRRGSLTPAQQRNWESLWPIVGRDATTPTTEPPTTAPPTTEPTRGDTGAARIDTSAWFGRTAPLILEIGSGTGTSTAAMATREPEFDVIAVEVYRPGIAQLVGFIAREDITNIRIVRGDAVVVLREMLEPASCTGVRVFFPDPWPKARHHKRRLLQTGTLALIADVLIDGGVLHVATDHAEYAEWIAEKLAEQDQLVPLTGAAPFSLDRPVTKFEGRAEKEGRSVTEFVLQRVPR
ncbi:tRNA (guanosine(46)-N7)-methyltransferase TrmB [Williamsia sp. CHRR-6]|uniref:tRNA (guanosine(46)-N7)-methyltransferase TrmB n=1 Tax=Williamsia sp. CHRR-6 TaxID=2835871 RepID=UPI001BD99002|nr:tRNA (guanosine(46)-N7)-methyltransferase TrmB [Williamsia sp. CHRR-6]MBT0567490.1 tRNA (guanosine(46)-N7)-methyltransferase TrmB [Williamsia sp. CHRR-6]